VRAARSVADGERGAGGARPGTDDAADEYADASGLNAADVYADAHTDARPHAHTRATDAHADASTNEYDTTAGDTHAPNIDADAARRRDGATGAAADRRGIAHAHGTVNRHPDAGADGSAAFRTGADVDDAVVQRR
jgi:hypothetical protein